MSSKPKWPDLIGRKLLVMPTDGLRGSGPFEYTLRDVSPSGANIKFENRAGRTFWCKATEYEVDDILPAE